MMLGLRRCLTSLPAVPCCAAVLAALILLSNIVSIVVFKIRLF
jgi:hypothetical protein